MGEEEEEEMMEEEDDDEETEAEADCISWIFLAGTFYPACHPLVDSGTMLGNERQKNDMISYESSLN